MVIHGAPRRPPPEFIPRLILVPQMDDRSVVEHGDVKRKGKSSGGLFRWFPYRTIDRGKLVEGVSGVVCQPPCTLLDSQRVINF